MTKNKRTVGRSKATGTKTSKTGANSRTMRSRSARTPKRKLFEPIGMTPTERLDAGEKLPKSLKNTGKTWKAEDVKELKTLAKGNTPTRVIGMKLGRSESAIRGKARSEGISLMPPNRSPYGTAK